MIGMACVSTRLCHTGCVTSEGIKTTLMDQQQQAPILTRDALVQLLQRASGESSLVYMWQKPYLR